MTTLRNDRHLSVHDLKRRISEGALDTVIVAFTDSQGRLQGRRTHASFFVDEVLENGIEARSGLLSGDTWLVLDLATIRLLPHLVGTAMVQADLAWPDQSPVAHSPRTVLQRQLAEAERHGQALLTRTEPEFLLFDVTYHDAWSAGYRHLVASSSSDVESSITGTSRVEPMLRDLRNGLYGAGLDVESVSGSGELGRQQISFGYADALVTADNHAVFKAMAKEIAAQHGRALTFMARYDERAHSSCRIQLSLRGVADSERFVAGVLATMIDFALLYAPNVNSYKRFASDAVAGGSALTMIAWSPADHPSCAVRVTGRGAGARLENRLPGADVNPYLALAAMIAGGLYGVSNALEPVAAAGDDRSPHPRAPSTLREARDAFAGSAVARAIFGVDVVDHYATAADIELAAFDAAVTDWERRRGFEQL